jgi:branched-chain amino acid transport system ATP-binding protein
MVPPPEVKIAAEVSSKAPAQLRTSGLSVVFGGVKALDNVDFHVGEREIVGLIGPNGAGKTTLVNVVTGFQRPTTGAVQLDGNNVAGKEPAWLARAGIVRTFQHVRLFGALTVLENIEAAALNRGVNRRLARERAWQSLELLGVAAKATADARALPHGEARRVGIARALVMNPRFLLLDEPAAGLNENESADLVERIAALPSNVGCAVVAIEHDMRVIMRLCHRLHVLNFGKTLSVGTPADIRNDKQVISAYLGTRSTH